MRDINVASVQFEHINGDKDANLECIGHYTREAAEDSIDIIAFPECCITGYWFLRHMSRKALAALAEPVPNGRACRLLRTLSEDAGITIGAGLVEIADDGQLYNTYFVAMPDGTWARHRKIHCFISEHMASGSEYTVFDTPHGCRVGVLICYDNNIVENVRMTALQGAEILLAPHQTGGCDSSDPCTMGKVDPTLWAQRETAPDKIEAELKGPKGREWLLRWLPARAHDNGLFLVFSNGIGPDDDEIRTGNAMILDPYGRILDETWAADNAIVTAHLDAALLDNCTGRRWIKTRRPELYGPLAVPTGLEEDTRKVRFDKRGA